ncbi:MAG TPA: amidohydrolase family protein [Vicinamibacteria bacterium]|nr:amidohydrolase family protein [Vicinamibacteria bacterium]
MILSLWLALAPMGGQPIPQPQLALLHANVIDVRTGGITADATIVLRDGKIASIGPGPAPAGAEVIDLEGRYVLPGLFDAHTHLDDLDRARRALQSGVTTARSASVGSYRDVVIGLMSKAGYIAGPDYLGAGVFVTPYIEDAVLASPSLMRLPVPIQSEEDLRALVRINVENGARVIKTRGTERAGRPDTDPREQVYTEAQLRAVVEEATRLGVFVLCHAHGDEGARAAVKAGVRSIEHGTYLSDGTLRLMKERGTYFVPTYTTMIDLLEPGGDYDDPVVKFRGLHMLPRIEDTFRRARALGIPIVTGADSSYGPESISRVSTEIVNYVKLGMSPLEAIQSGTVRAAELFGLEKETGALEPGLEADLIVIEKNPLEDIRVIQDIILVISNGRVGLKRLPFGRK